MKIVVDGMSFDADAAGERGAPLVVLLHGFPHSSYSWRHQLPALGAAGYFAVAPNQRGYSPGARLTGVASYGAELLVADVLHMAATLGYEQFHLVGHDWGGQLAWLLGAQHAKHVRSLTVLSRPHPAAFARSLSVDPEQGTRSRHHQSFLDPGAADLLLADNAARLREALHSLAVPDDAVAEYLQVLGEYDALDAALNWYRAAAPPHRQLMAGDVPDVSVPTCYLWGDRDSTVGRSAAEFTRHHVTGQYRFEELPGIGHAITDEVPETVNRLLLEFLQDQP